MTLITRKEWGAETPDPMTGRTLAEIVAVVFHYSDTAARFHLPDEEAAVRAIQRYHMHTKGWADIGYNALVGMTGNVYEGRNTRWVPAHCEGYNRPSLGICFLTNGGITPEAGAAAVELVQINEYLIGRKLAKYGHREKRQTHCPGDTIMGWVETVRRPGGPLA